MKVEDKAFDTFNIFLCKHCGTFVPTMDEGCKVNCHVCGKEMVFIPARDQTDVIKYREGTKGETKMKTEMTKKQKEEKAKEMLDKLGKAFYEVDGIAIDNNLAIDFVCNISIFDMEKGTYGDCFDGSLFAKGTKNCLLLETEMLKEELDKTDEEFINW